MSYFETLKNRQASTAPESVKPLSSFEALKERQKLIGEQSKKEEPKKSFGRKVVDFFTSSTQKFGKTIGESQAVRSNVDKFSKTNADADAIDYEISKKIQDKEKNGEDTSFLRDSLIKHRESRPTMEDFTGDVINKTTGQVLGEGIGAGLESLSGGLLSSGKKVLTNKALSTFGKVKASALATAPYTAVAGGSGAMQEGGGIGETIAGTAIGGASGLVLGGALGYAGAKIGNKLVPSKNQLVSNLDDQIKSIFKDTTGDVNKINNSAFKAKKGLELLNKESANILIPDPDAPIGSNATKIFNLKKSTPNELLSGVLEMDKKIASNARQAAQKAQQSGLKIDISDAEKLINKAVERGDIPKATGNRLALQIRSTKGNPVDVHDWVQNINMKYGKKYQRQTIDDTSLGSLADDVADTFRTKLDSIVDRKGYAEAFSNNQELKRMLVAIAKKANKGVNFGDITSDAGLDLGISILTGNPAYMARTIGTSLFRGFLSNLRNNSGIRAFKNAANIIEKLPSETRLPSSEIKPQKPILQLPAGRKTLPENPTLYVTPKGTATPVKQEAIDLGAVESGKIKQPKTDDELMSLQETLNKTKQKQNDSNIDSSDIEALNDLDKKEIRSEELALKAIEIQNLEETLASSPAKRLVKYTAKTGDNPGTLPLLKDKNSGPRSRFSKEGDGIIQESGYLDVEEAQTALEKYQKDQKRLNELKKEYKEENSKGSVNKKMLGIGSSLASVGALGANMLGKPSEAIKNNKQENKPSLKLKEKKDNKTKKFLDAIAYNETNTIKEPYLYNKPSGNPDLGYDLGRYQVTEGELKTYGKRYLGYVPTKNEFLSSPELQDKYMVEKLKYLEKEGYSVAEIADIHRKGIKNVQPRGKDTYQSPDYVKGFLAQYNK